MFTKALRVDKQEKFRRGLGVRWLTIAEEELAEWANQELAELAMLAVAHNKKLAHSGDFVRAHNFIHNES